MQRTLQLSNAIEYSMVLGPMQDSKLAKAKRTEIPMTASMPELLKYQLCRQRLAPAQLQCICIKHRHTPHEGTRAHLCMSHASNASCRKLHASRHAACCSSEPQWFVEPSNGALEAAAAADCKWEAASGRLQVGGWKWDTELLRLQLPLASGAVAHASAQTSSAQMALTPPAA